MDKDPIEWFNTFHKKPLLENKNIVELLQYGDYSLWWYLEWFLEYGCFYCTSIRHILNHPENKTYQNTISVYLNFIRLLLRKIIWSIFCMFNNKDDKSKKSIAMISTLNHEIYDGKKDKIIEGDRFIPILNRLDGSYNLFLINIPFKKELGFKSFFNTIQNGAICLPIESFIGIKECLSAFKQYRHYKAIWKKIKKTPFAEKSIKNHLIKNFDLFFSPFLLRILIEIEAYKTLFSKYQMDLVCTYDVFSPSGFNARLAFTGKMLGIQSGTWCANLVEYNHSSEDLESYPLMDLIAVYGPKIKQNLIQSKNLPDSKLVVIENPLKMELLDKLKYYGISPTNTAIVFISQNLKIYDEDEYSHFIKELFLFFKAYPGEQKIIRPHPSENPDFFKQLISLYDIKNVSISHNQDVFLVLIKAKLVISAYSTCLTHAQLLNKPVVSLDVCNKHYSEIIYCPGVSNAYELSEFFNNLKPAINNEPAQSPNLVSLIKEVVE